MRGKALIRAGYLILSLMFIIGCREDSGPSSSAPAPPPPAWISGEINLYYGQTRLNMGVYKNSGAYLTVDSVMAGDSLCPVDTTYAWNESDPVWEVEFNESGENFMYQSGDTARVVVHSGSLSSACRLVLLDEREDELQWISPSLGGSMAPGQDIECIWKKMARAEWYGIELNIRRKSGDSFHWENYYFYTFDTTYTLDTELLGDSVNYLYVYVLPTNGPDPTSTRSNWEGRLATGKLYSTGGFTNTLVYIREPGTVKASPGPLDGLLPPIQKGRELIETIYDIYK